MATPREKTARSALKILDRDRLTKFIRAIRQQPGCDAVRLMNEELDAGKELSSIFLTGDEFGFQLSASPLGPNRYKIEFGWRGGPLVGDGAEWDVQFEPDGSVSRVVRSGLWIA